MLTFTLAHIYLRPFFCPITALASHEPDPPKCNEDWMHEKVKYDIRHWMGIVFLMASTKDTPMFKYFCTAISDAIFEVVPESRLAVKDHLKSLGVTDAEILRVRRKYWRSHYQYVVLSPEELQRDVTDVYEFFVDIVDPSTGRNFFNPDHAKRFRTGMSYIRKGYLSDIPGLPMYIQIGKYTSGLAGFICVRSSSGLGGYHLHLRQVSIATANVLHGGRKAE